VTAFRYAERAARLLRAARARIQPYRSAPPENAIAAVAQAIAQATARQRRRRAATAFGITAALSAAGLLVVIAPWKSRRTPLAQPARAAIAPLPGFVAASQTRAMLASADGQFRPLSAGEAWGSDEELRTEALPVTLAAQDGTTVDLAPRSDLKLLRADSEQWLRLGSGAVAVHVAKLKEGQRFVVLTPDAEVEVRGTRFHVALASPAEDCGHGTPTRVVVDEGVVVVRSSAGEVRVPAGERWPADCAEPRAPIAPAVTEHTVTRRAPKPAAPPQPLPSTLATENDLFGAALRAERSGDRTEAAHLLDALLSRFPTSPLTESAQRARARLTAAVSLPSP
jgi:ferric-dicitrate binding protein FerR (iron transport regulator)